MCVLLQATEGLMVKVASVIGFSFTLNMLRTILTSLDIDSTFAGLHATANSMQQLGILVQVSGSHDTFEYAHKFLYDVAYGQLAEELKLQLHHVIASTTEDALYRRMARTAGRLTLPSFCRGGIEFPKEERAAIRIQANYRGASVRRGAAGRRTAVGGKAAGEAAASARNQPVSPKPRSSSSGRPAAAVGSRNE